LDASEAAPGYISRNTFSLFIGEHGDRHGGEWNGLIDDVCLTSYALTEQEVRELYERTNDGDAK